MTQSLTRGFLVFTLLASFAVPSAADAATASITIGDINGGAVLGASTQTLTDAQISAVLGLLQAFGANQSTVNNVRNALKGTTSGTDTGSTPTTTTPSSNSNEPPSDEGSSSNSSASSFSSSSSNEPVVITGTGYHEGKFYVKTALSGTGQKYRYLEKGVSVVLGGQTYHTTSGTRVGNVYVPNSLASQLLVGSLVTVLKPDIVVTGTGTSEGGTFFVTTSQSGPNREFREIPLGELFTIGDVPYRTIAGSSVGNIYLPKSAISYIAIGAVVVRGDSSPFSTSTGLSDASISSIVSLLQSFGSTDTVVGGAVRVLRGNGGVKISHSLTDSQVKSVLSLLQSLLQSFGASASILQDMEVFLGRSSQVISGTPSLSVTGPASGATFARTGDIPITWSVANVPHDMLVVGDVTLVSASQPWQGTVSGGSFQATVHAGNSSGSHLWQLGTNDSVAGTYSIKLKLQECLNNNCSLNPNVPGATPTNVLAYSALGGTITVLRSTTDTPPPTTSASPVVGIMSLPSTGLEDGRLIRFKVNAERGDVGIGKFAFNIQGHKYASGQVDLHAYTDIYYSSPVSGFFTNGAIGTGQISGFGAPVAVILSKPLEIPKGGTYYFELRDSGKDPGVINGASALTTRLLGDDVSGGTESFAIMKEKGHFIWSPNSTTTSSFSHDDWINGFGVPGLPAGGISQTRTGESTTTYACSDGIDNDGDSFKDAEDPGCSGASDNDEYNAPVATTASPSCTLSASPSSVTAGGSVTLKWGALNATSFSINQGVGIVSPASSGSKSVVVPSTRTYTGTATGSGGTAYCGTTVTTSAPAPESTTSSQPTVTSTGYYNGIFYAKTTESGSGEAYRTIAKGETFIIGGKAYQTVSGSNVGSVYLPQGADAAVFVGDTVVKSSSSGSAP